jgi:CBS domain containing-hemolysin-like protein
VNGAGWLGAAALFFAVVGACAAAAEAAIGQLPASEIRAAASSRGWGLRTIARNPAQAALSSSFLRLLAQSLCAVLLTLALSRVIQNPWVLLVCAVVAVAVVAILLLGVSPRSLGQRAPIRVLRSTSTLIALSCAIFGGITGSVQRVRRRRIQTPAPSLHGEEALLHMVDRAAEQQHMESDEQELIHSVFEFQQTLTRSIMVPRTDMSTLAVQSTVAQALAEFFRTGFSRLPVEGEDVDDIRGVLYLRDTARAAQGTGGAEIPIASLVRPASFVPESKPVDDLLREMQRDRIHMAIVIDEYGGVAGLATLEDVLEELVGEITDEYDHDLPEMQRVGEGRLRVLARTSAEDVGDAYGVDITEDDVDSIGGLFVKYLGALPTTGATVHVGPLLLTAERVDPRNRRLITVLAERVGPGPEPHLPEQAR